MHADAGIRESTIPDKGTALGREGDREPRELLDSRWLRSPARGETSPRAKADIPALMPLTTRIQADCLTDSPPVDQIAPHSYVGRSDQLTCDLLPQKAELFDDDFA
jgi:hypothetical protein